MADMFKRMFLIPVMKEALQQFAATTPSDVPIQDREINEAIDGTILHGLVSNAAERHLNRAEENSSSDDEVADLQQFSDAESNYNSESNSDSELASDSASPDSDDEQPEVRNTT